MTLALDHLFVFVDSLQRASAAMQRVGLTESFTRRHHGQGTVNRCFCFDNAYVELLQVVNAEELAGPAIRRTGLLHRSQWPVNGSNPFGIGVRVTRGAMAPFSTWPYKPPYLPNGVAVHVALDSDDPIQPFMFVSPAKDPPSCWTDGRAGSLQRARGFVNIRRMRISLPTGHSPSGALLALEQCGVEVAYSGSGYRVQLVIERQNGGPPFSLEIVPEGNRITLVASPAS